jgi:hypothetical protein
VTDARRTFPWHHAAMVSVLCTLFLLFFAGFPQEGDEVTALAIAEQAGDPGRYPQSDLLMVAGERGPYHFYRAIGLLYAAHAPVELIWFVGYLICTVATVVALFAIAEELNGDSRVAAIAATAIAVASPYRGTLHWFLIPAPNLVTSTAAMPLALWGMLLALRTKFGPALALAAVTFFVHPAIGLIAGAAIGILLLRERGPGELLRLRGWVALSALIGIAAVVLILRQTPGLASLPPAAPLMSFAEQLSVYAYHVFPADHWREGYAFFVAEIAGALMLLRRFGGEKAVRAVTMGAVFLVLIVLAIVNTFTINYLPITLAFPVRAAPFVKTIAWIATFSGMACWIRAAPRTWPPLAAASCLLLAALGKNADIAEGFALVGWSIAAWQLLSARPAWRMPVVALLMIAGIAEILAPGWGILRIGPASPQLFDYIRLLGIAAALAFFVLAIAARIAPTDVLSAPNRPVTLAGIAGLAVAVMILALGLRGRPDAFVPQSASAVGARIGIGVPDSTVVPLFDWLAREGPRSALLAAPPLDDRFSAVRLAGATGLYVNVGEVNQLVYDPRLYAEGHARMLRLGVRVGGRHAFDDRAYATLSQDSVRALSNEGVTFVVFPREARLRSPLTIPIAYQDTRWIVYDLR